MRIDRLTLLALCIALGCGTTVEAPLATPEAPVEATPPPLPPAQPSPPPPPPQGVRPFAVVLGTLPSATHVQVTQGWNGLSATAPIAHRYELSISAAAVTAHVVCSAARQEHPLPDLVLAPGILDPILTHLSTATVELGPYTPRIQHTDDYPNLTIVIETPAAIVTFASRSQGELAEPWQISVGADTGVIASTIPGEALRDLLALARGDRCREWSEALAFQPSRRFGVF